MWTSMELKVRAKGAFYKNYWHCVLTALVMSIFAGVVVYNFFGVFYDHDMYWHTNLFWEKSRVLLLQAFYTLVDVRVVGGITGILFLFLKVFLGNVLFVGGCRFFIMNQTMNPMAVELGFGMNPQAYGKMVQTMLLKDLYTMLWSLLFVIPGVIKHYEYLMIPYILGENPEMDYKEAFLISRRMMEGQKMNAFVLDLTFIGWAIVSSLTLGIVGVFFVQPYYQATRAELYSWNRMIAYQEGYIR